jgi:hypothetical protein
MEKNISNGVLNNLGSPELKTCNPYRIEMIINILKMTP